MKQLSNKSSWMVFTATLIFFGMIVSACADQRADELTLRLPETDLTITRNGDGDAQFDGKDIRFATQAGEPALPFREVTVLLPPDADLRTVSVSLAQTQEETLDGVWEVSPTPPLIQMDGDQGSPIWPEDTKIVNGRDTAVYGRDAVFPEFLTGTYRTGQISSWRLVHVLVPLARYNPQTKALTRLHDAQIVVSFNRDPSLSTSAQAVMIGSATSSEQRVKSMALNYDAMAPAYAPKEAAALAAQLPADGYVIITTSEIYNPLHSQAAIDRFADDKRGKGFNVWIKTEADWDVGAGAEKADRLRGWLQTHYVESDMNIKYALLIGDPDPDDQLDPGDTVGDVPMKMLWIVYRPPIQFESPSDYYYADMTGNWDFDGDRFYGERGDDYGPAGGVDLDYEIAVGRIPHYPSDGPAVLDGILDKIRNYSNSPDTAWRKHALLPMKPISDFGAVSDYSYPMGEYLKDDILIPNNWGYHRVYDDHVNLAPEPESMPTTLDTVMAAWTSRPFGAVFWFAHGGSPVAQEVIDSSRVSLLDDTHPSFTFQLSCDTAWPEDSNNLAYALLKHGAVSTIGATRETSFTSGRTDNMEYMYAYFLIGENKPAGNAFYDMKEYINNNTIWQNLTHMNLYGDPALGLFNGTPPVITTIAPTGRTHSFAAETGSVAVTAPAGVDWSAISGDAWVVITSGASGTGNGTIEYSLMENTTGHGRTGMIIVRENTDPYGEKYRVTQRTHFELDSANNPHGFNNGAVGDFDNDGYADLATPGRDRVSWEPSPRLLKNTGGIFSDISSTGLDEADGSVAWGDYDNDGDLDLAMAVVLNDGLPIYATRIYRNDGPDGTSWKLTDIASTMSEIGYSALDWGDFDDDGDLDLLLTGRKADSSLIAEIYQNNGPISGGWQFDVVTPALPDPLYNGSVAWGDYDNDGRIDILLTGDTVSQPSPTAPTVPPVYVTKLYHNEGPGTSPSPGTWYFSEVSTGLPGVGGYSGWYGGSGSGSWGDYDNDGDPDIVLTGKTNDPTPTFIANIYRNDGSGGSGSWIFTDINAGLTGANEGGVAWGDYDGDGDLDLAVVGSYVVNDPGAVPIKQARMYRNDGAGVFTDIHAGLLAREESCVSWVDYDNDGVLDLFVPKIGYIEDSSIYHSSFPAGTSTQNTVPSAPTGLSQVQTGGTVRFSWNAGSDAETPAAGLTYNLYIGTTPGGVEIMSPHANTATGARRIVAMGNAQKNRAWSVSLPAGRYYWSVQTIDSVFAGSPFATERTFVVDPVISGTVTDLDGSPLAGVMMAGLPGSPVTGADGKYSAVVPMGWSGTVTPAMSGKYFRPANRVYANLVTDAAGQDYVVVPAALRAQYYNSSPAPNNNTIFVRIRIFNDGNTNIDIKDIETRYWYTNDGNGSVAVDIDYAGNMPSGRYIRPYTAAQVDGWGRALAVLRTSFRTGAGSLRPSSVRDSYVDVHMRIHEPNYQWMYDQSNDYSYGNHSWYQNWLKVAVYYKGVLCWGMEP